MRLSAITLAAAGWLVLCCAMPLPADVLVLTTGGKIEGKITPTGKPPGSEYDVELESGGKITLAANQVDRIVPDSPKEMEYRGRARSARDDVESHWELAIWCGENGQQSYADRHLERILQLDPDHAEARRRLGYRAVQGKWLTRDQLMAARGMIMYRGEYRSKQEIEILQRNEISDDTSAEWRDKLKRWYRRLSDRKPERAQEARDNFASLRDPRAAKPLVDFLSREKRPSLRLFFLEILSQLEHQEAFDALVHHSLYDPVEEVRAQSLAYLLDSRRPGIAGPFIRALRNKDNIIVNRAARALREINDPRSIRPLIDALVTEHKRVQGSGGSGGQQYAFSPTSGGFSMGGGAPRVIKEKRANNDVLSALVALSGGRSFEYDESRWRDWLASQTNVAEVNLRRDD